MTDQLPEEWTPEQLRVYGALFDAGMSNQALITHPETGEIAPRHWQTIVHNMAYLAATAMDPDAGIILHDTATDQVVGAFFQAPTTRH